MKICNTCFTVYKNCSCLSYSFTNQPYLFFSLNNFSQKMILTYFIYSETLTIYLISYSLNKQRFWGRTAKFMPKGFPQRSGDFSDMRAVLHHSPSYDLPSTRIWSKLAEKWQSYWMGAVLRAAPPERAPRRHVRHRSVPATLRHDVPS